MDATRCIRSPRGILAAALAATLAASAACRIEVGAPDKRASDDGSPSEVWIYTSMYQHVIDEMTPALAEAMPDVQVEWYQAGSEKVAQRWEAEHEAGGSRACLLATSAPGWYLDLTDRGLLREYVSPRGLDLPRRWLTPTWSAFRISLMVMASTDEEAPASFAELADERWQGRFSTGDPMSSGTNFATLSAFEMRYGWDWLDALQANGWIAAGGNSAVLSRMDSGERRIGVVLLENLLAKPDVARTIFPTDGAVAVPGPLAIPTDCPDPEAAERVYDWMLGEEAQRAIVNGFMHSPLPGVAPPAGVPPLADIALMDLPDDFLRRVADGAADRKQRFLDLRG